VGRDKLKLPIQNAIFPPVSGQEQFAMWVGVTPDTVRGWVEGGTLPTVKIGRHRFINVFELINELSQGKSTFQREDFSS